MSRKKILIIEDNDIDTLLLRKTLESEYEVQTETDGERGLTAAFTSLYDLIILDITLPGLSGREVYEKIKNDPSLKNTPIILKGAFQPQPYEWMDKTDLYLIKPFKIKDLFSIVRELLGDD